MTNRHCFHADESFVNVDGFPQIVKITENEPGYTLYATRTTLDQAVTDAAWGNKGLGLTEQDVLDIRTSSMALSFQPTPARHILLMNSFDGEAHLVVLPDTYDQCTELSTIWEHAYLSSEEPYDKVFLIDPNLNDHPMPCTVNGVTTPFDDDDRATTTMTVFLDGMDEPFTVQRFSYSVDGRG